MGFFLNENLYITDFFARSNGVSPPPKKPHPPAPKRPQRGPRSLPSGMARDVPLAPMTTLGVGGPAEYFASTTSVAGCQALLAWAHDNSLPVALLGGGSNLVVHDRGVPGLVVRYLSSDAQAVMQRLDGHRVVLHGGAPWSLAAEAMAHMALYGAEALVGIPGTVGAAVAQNIGAYGQELSELVTDIEVVHRKTGQTLRLAPRDVHFGYRYSHLRTGDGLWSNRYIVTAVHLQMGDRRPSPITFPALKDALEASGESPLAASPITVGETVYRLRQSRGMVWPNPERPMGTVGSFFKNPVLTKEQLLALKADWPHMPHHPGAMGHKVPAAWLIENAGYTRGWRSPMGLGRVGLSELHALALCNLGGAQAVDIVAAATTIYESVRKTFGIALVAEAQTMGFDAPMPPFY